MLLLAKDNQVFAVGRKRAVVDLYLCSFGPFPGVVDLYMFSFAYRVGKVDLFLSGQGPRTGLGQTILSKFTHRQITVARIRRTVEEQSTTWFW